VILRDYQQDCIARLRESYGEGRRAPLLQLATGGGKTIVFGAITSAAAARRKQVLIVAHRRELIRQASAKLAWAGVAHGIIARDLDRSHDLPVQVGSVQTIARRLARLPQFDLVVFDEAHHARAGTWGRLLDHQHRARLLGVTATPARLDGKGLGVDAGGCFDDLVLGPSTKELIDSGWLSPVRCFVPARRIDLSGVKTIAGDWDRDQLAAVVDTKAIIGDAVEHYRARLDHHPAIAFCIGVDHAEHVAAGFRRAGYRSYCVHGGTPKSERDDLILGLGTGDVEVLTSCALIDEGLDVPAVAGVILLRPTQSTVLHRQQIGRGMRTMPGKAALVVNDHVGNTLRHGPPEIEPRWSLAGIDKGESEAPERAAAAPAVAFDWRALVAPGALAELSAGDLASVPYRLIVERFMQAEISELDVRAYAAARGYKPGWVWHLKRAREASI
jgi:DNA repair protein RadD